MAGGTVPAGAAVVDVTPAIGGAMSGFVARSSPSTGVHDPITVRALCVANTALVTVDVVGLHEEFCAAVARRTSLAAADVRVHATHTHGGPAAVVDRLGGGTDPVWLARLEQACVDAVEEARRNQRPARLFAGQADEVPVARNRRRPDGPVDRSLPVARLVGVDGATIAVLVSYACHPVVLGADNTLLTADYPGVVRRQIEEAVPGSVALFLTGCAGDANTGHAASTSVTLQAADHRTFAAAEAAGTTIAEAILAARLVPTGGPVRSAVAQTELTVEVDPAAAEALRWNAMAEDPATDPATAALLRCWTDWAERHAASAPATWTARVGLLRWGEVTIVTLPGEPFARTGHELRAAAHAAGPAADPMAEPAGPMAEPAAGRVAGPGVTFVAGYTDGCPGYLAPADEIERGGYEVLEAHRYYGMPGPFAPGSAERLTATAIKLLRASSD